MAHLRTYIYMYLPRQSAANQEEITRDERTEPPTLRARVKYLRACTGTSKSTVVVLSVVLHRYSTRQHQVKYKVIVYNLSKYKYLNKNTADSAQNQAPLPYPRWFYACVRACLAE